MLFVLSKVFWFVFNPGNLLVLCLCLGVAGTLLPWRRARALGRGLLALAAAAALGLTVLPLGDLMLSPLEDRFPAPRALPPAVDGIIVLGGDIDPVLSSRRDAVQVNESADRAIAFASLARRYPAARLIFTGGSGALFSRDLREADFARRQFADLGADMGRITFERNARNTRENALFAKDAMQPKEGETWILVTSAYHMARSVGVFRGVGWEVLPYPVDYATAPGAAWRLRFDFESGLSHASLAVREWVGLAAYRLFGWTNRLFPAPRNSG